MHKFDQADSTDLLKRLREMEERITQLETARRLESASIGAGGIRVINGGSVIVDGGDLKLINPDGVEVARFGDVGIGGGTSRGWQFKFDSGETAFALSGAPGKQFWQLRDKHGNYIFTNDASTGYGMGRPYIPYRLVPTFAAQQDSTLFWPSTLSATPVDLWSGWNPLWHPRLAIGVTHVTNGVGVAHWSLTVNGVTVIADETGTGRYNVVVPGWGTDIVPGADIDIRLNGWNVGGGRTYLQCDRIYGLQS